MTVARLAEAADEDRVARLELKDPAPATAGMLSEWELFKADWTKK